MRAIVIRRTITLSYIKRIIAVVEKSHRALLVERAGERVGNSCLQAVAEPFLHVRLQCVVGGKSLGRISLRLIREPDVWIAQIGIAAFGSGDHGLSAGQREWAAVSKRIVSSGARVGLHRITICI